MHLLPTLLFAATEARPPTRSTSDVPAADPLIPLLPILGFAFTALFGRRLRRSRAAARPRSCRSAS